MTRYYLGISSATNIELQPDEGLSIAKKIIINQQRTGAGYMYEHKVCHYDSISIPVAHVPASVAYIVNSWWQTQTQLQFIISGDESAGSSYLSYHQERYYPGLYYPGRYWPKWIAYTDVFSCHIANGDSPLKGTSLPYSNRFKGSILLEGY